MRSEDILLRDFLVDAGLVSRSQMSDVLERLARAEGEGAAATLGALLARDGLLERDELRRATAHALGVPFVELDPRDIATEAMILIPEPVARARNVFAYRRAGEGLEVAVLDLADLAHLGDVARAQRILPRLTSERSMRVLLQHYQKHLKEKFGEMLTAGRHLSDALIRHAIYSRAGGVHIDPGHLGTLVRYQIGHALHEAFVLPEQAGKQLVAQLKSFAKLLPVARPQEGKFKVDLSAQAGHDGDVVHVRVHTLPGQGGERVHLRLAPASQSARGYTLESLGFHGEALDAVERHLARRRGLVLVRGNEGAGKTTLLMTLADLLASPHTTLVHTNSAAALRAALRHDPDVVVVDDLVDESLAALASAAAQRGTLVLAAADYSAPKVNADLMVHVARVARLCTKAFYDTAKLGRRDADALAQYANFTKLLSALKDEHVVGAGVAWKDVAFARATACSECKGGYRGHVGLQQVEEGGAVVGLNLVEDGLFKSAQGLTSLDEIVALLQ